MRRVGHSILGIRRVLAAIIGVAMTTLVWATVARAQSAEDQYGSPTDTATGSVAETLTGVLPDTGGPLLLVIVGAVMIAGAGITLLRAGSGRR